MHHGDGQTPHPTGVFHIQYRTVYVHSIGIGPVKHHKIFVIGGCLFHQPYHRDIICVIAQPDILNITYYHIESGQNIRCYAATFAVVHRCYGYARHRINAAADMFAGIGVAAKSMLGRKYRGDVHSAFEHNIQGMTVAHHTGMIGEQCHALASQQRQIRLGAGGAHYDAVTDRALRLGCAAWCLGGAEHG